MDVPGGQVGECAAALVLELDQRRAARSDGDGRVLAPERLQLGLLSRPDLREDDPAPERERFYRRDVDPK
jgi:hypothetical protein